MMKEQLLSPQQAEAVTAVLRVLTHAHRLRICELLLHGSFSVGAVAEKLDLRQSVVSQHLNMLRAHGIVRPERAGRQVYYRVIHPAAGWLLGCVQQHVDKSAEK
ncbi:MAG: metalloregulator ArsR/SmtB family transcription factor [Planctomycetota bacterium]